MLEIEIDVYSGMPNPTFQLTGREEQEFLDRVLAEPAQMTPAADPSATLGLGYRGMIARLVMTDDGPWSTTALPESAELATGLPALPGTLPFEFRVGSQPASDDTSSWLIGLSESKLDIDGELREALQQGVAEVPDAEVAEPDFGLAPEAAPELVIPRAANWQACRSSFLSNNAALFNRPEYVQRNNCYCFASNHLANVRYAKPGRRGGRPATALQCQQVIAGLRADGWIDGCSTSTLTIALVIWPNQDYHFYRLITAGPLWWWGHKPGATPARFTDESGRALKQPLSPANCNRGNYSQFCGFFYQSNNTARVA